MTMSELEMHWQVLLEPYFRVFEYRPLDLHSRVFIGSLQGDPSETSEKLFSALINAGFTPAIREIREDVYELLVFDTPPSKPSNFWIHVVLFALTVLTTLFAGALHAGVNVFKHPLQIWKGIPFSASLLAILGTHEMGHYLLAKWHKVRATLPYFIPFPHPLFGTLGAVIRIKSPIPSRNALMDLGAAGPVFGFLVAIPVAILGIHLSLVIPMETVEGGLLIGDPLIFRLIVYFVKGGLPDGYQILIHPIGFAAWIGFFVTALNLIPIAQLDGGHILYAVLGPKHKLASLTVFVILVALGFVWPGWWTWAFFILIFLRFGHPAPLNQVSKLDTKRKWVGFITLLIFILTFVPVPLSYS